ncbi:dihydrolipoyl dehydrogenase [Paenibacillus silvae]|uniref:dihydrolipoyl dehydrogenase n=1 Tax=Paenibacillus TaxID=44249 RepID=UPI002003948D|nr:dihydrolipoyl dehydrogenase [Paenibacillus silvae]MCK6073290.1 dihydrolipoyl dehydrogenase [Paenibacillus silvae]MCK6149234.1 dihydrolipoyl dehydrogenase [Paenibacillus silvae]MCK6267533.1 dihydrolipoyl dehydrogenase [Paenibacillus silvae]
MKQLELVDTLVIGSGPGGYVAALRSSQLGMKTAIVEREQVGGVCTHVGCIPSKALIAEAERFHIRKQLGAVHEADAYPQAQAFKQAVVNKQSGGVQFLLKTAGVTLLEGEARLIDAHTARIHHAENGVQQIGFKHLILATGSRPIEIASLPFGGRILSSTEALSLPHIPKSLVVVGGGYIGVELGQMFARFGANVTILEGGEQVLPGFESEIVSPVIRQLQKDGITMITGAKVSGAEQHNSNIDLNYTRQNEQYVIQAEYALVTVGRKPNTDGALGLEHIGLTSDSRGLIEVDEQCRTAIPHIYAIGDIVQGPALAHKASYEAKIAAEAIAGQPSAIDYKALPLVVFSHPEVTSVGLSETSCKQQSIPVIVGKSVFSINGRALALKETEGFVKIVAHATTGLVLGAQIVGAEASTLISELSLAIEMGATVEDLAMTIHPHPTLGEIIMEAAEHACRKIEKN